MAAQRTAKQKAASRANLVKARNARKSNRYSSHIEKAVNSKAYRDLMARRGTMDSYDFQRAKNDILYKPLAGRKVKGKRKK